MPQPLVKPKLNRTAKHADPTVFFTSVSALMLWLSRQNHASRESAAAGQSEQDHLMSLPLRRLSALRVSVATPTAEA